MIDSESSSISFSTAAMSFSICAFVTPSIPSCSMTLSSRSKSLIAYHLCCSSGIEWTQASSICASACSTLPEKVCIGTVFSLEFAASIAACAASLTPLPLRADISTTLQPSCFASSLVFILSPFFSTTSIILTATATGMPSSTSCVVR